MISLTDVPQNVEDSKAVMTEKRKSLLSFTEKYLAQIEYAEKKIHPDTKKAYVDRVNDQRQFIDSLIEFLQSSEETIKMLSHYISDMLEFYEAEISNGGKICHDIQYWKNQTIRKDGAKRRIIKAFSRVLNEEQKDKLFKLLTE